MAVNDSILSVADWFTLYSFAIHGQLTIICYYCNNYKKLTANVKILSKVIIKNLPKTCLTYFGSFFRLN